MYWDQVVKEIQNKESIQQNFAFTSVNLRKKVRCVKCPSLVAKKRRPKIYDLGLLQQEVHFSQREAEVMVHLLRGRTINMTAQALELSARTIEFYVKNMKKKLNCRSKAQLIDIVINSAFMVHVDFIV